MSQPSSAPPEIDLHEQMLQEVNAAVDRLTLRATPANRPRRVRFGTILVGHDGTSGAQHALEWGALVAQLHDARVLLASVVPPPRAYGTEPLGFGTYWPAMQAELERAEADMRAAVARGTAYLRAHHVDARGVVEVGSAAPELAALARREGADLVVLGARNGRGIERALLGSVARSVASRVPASILVARAEPDDAPILAATDGSAESDRAVTLALEMASAREVDLVVQHVLEFPGDRASVPPEGYLQGIIEGMTLPTPPHVRYVMDVGAPAERILERARAEACGLVVVGARGLGRVRAALLGSVSQRVADAAGTNVLVVRGEPDA